MLQNAELVGGIGSFKLDNPNDFTYVDVFQFQVTFIYRNASFPKGFKFKSLSDFAPYKIGILDGSPLISNFQAAGLSLDLSPSPDTDIKKLIAGRIDFVAMPDLVGYFLLKQNGESIDNYGVTNPLSIVKASIVFPKKFPGSDTIVQNMKNGLAMIKKNGTALKIMEEYYGVGKVPDWVLNF
jgi:polar amino acid transport system substrate-binding protein